MFAKNNMHPVLAYAAASGGKNIQNGKYDAFTFSAPTDADAEGFGAFDGNDHQPRAPKKRPGAAPGKKENKNKSLITIAIAAAAAVVVLVLLICAVALLAGSKDITYDDNAYIAFADGDGTYHVYVNGKEVAQEFEGEVELIPSADNAFAYIVDHGSEGDHVYLVEGKKITPITSPSSPVKDVIAFASLKPGVITEEDNYYRLYVGDSYENIVRKDFEPDDFYISADASTVLYTAFPNKNTSDSPADRRTYIYQNSSPVPVKNCKPVGISNYGDYAYVVPTTGENQNALYVLTTKDAEQYPVDKSIGFSGIIATNLKGDEVLFYTTSQGEDNTVKNSTYVYRFKKNGTGETASLGDRLMAPSNAESDVAIYDTFAKTYMDAYAPDGSDRGVYYVRKDFSSKSIAPLHGQFSPDGKSFYFISTNDEGDSILRHVDLTDETYKKTKVFDGAVNFAVTNKGNVYHVDDHDLGTLSFYSKSTGSSSKRGLGDDITSISFYNYANTIYYTIADVEGELRVYVSSEGSEKEEAEMESTTLTELPVFTNPYSKNTYAFYYSEEEASWKLYYTSNGRRFTLISNDCMLDDLVDGPSHKEENNNTGNNTDTNPPASSGDSVG